MALNHMLLLVSASLFVLSSSLPLQKDDSRSLLELDTRINLIDSAMNNDDQVSVIDLSKWFKSMVGQPDNQTGERLLRWTQEDRVNPEEMGSYLEGDILIPESHMRNGMKSNAYRWPQGQIPYTIEGAFTQNERNIISHAIREYKAKTCIRFIPRTNQRDFLAIQNQASGCWSSVGKTGGKQVVNMQSACFNQRGTMIHELMHAVGFMHEQNRSERDGYVTINWANLQAGVDNNFAKASPTEVHAWNVPYDYYSVMHYSAYAFSKNGQPTIQAKINRVGINMGQREGFSPKDIAKINAMYGCKIRRNRRRKNHKKIEDVLESSNISEK